MALFSRSKWCFYIAIFRHDIALNRSLSPRKNFFAALPSRHKYSLKNTFALVAKKQVQV
jgi:hypothetical protein